MIQNRMTMVGSAQPFFSKWWCSGAIRNTRRPVRLNQNTCTMTRHRLDHEQAADDQQHDLVLRRDRDRAERAAEGEAAGVAHEHRRRAAR